ncbi:unnamed protein product [Sphagnum tenellum]
MTTPEPHSSLILANIYVCLPSVFLSSGMKWDAAAAADKRRAISIRTGGGQLYLQLESGAVTTSIMQVSAAAAATVDQGKKKKKKKQQSTTVRSKSPHHVSSSHATRAPASCSHGYAAGHDQLAAGSSWQSSCEFTAATVSGGCSFNAHQLGGSSAAVNQRIEGRILLQQHDDDHEPAGFMLQQVGIREEQWSDNSNHHHLQTMCNDLPGQQQHVMESSWWGQKRVKTSQGFGFNMVTSSCAAVEAQPTAANPSPDQLEHGCVMQSRWKTKT